MIEGYTYPQTGPWFPFTHQLATQPKTLGGSRGNTKYKTHVFSIFKLLKETPILSRLHHFNCGLSGSRSVAAFGHWQPAAMERTLVNHVFRYPMMGFTQILDASLSIQTCK